MRQTKIFLLPKKKNVIEKVILPSKLTIVISYADVCTDLAKRVGLLNQTYMLNGRWAISLLNEMPVGEVLEHLHGKYAWRYTNCWVEKLLKPKFIYSFVCDQDMLEKVLFNENYTLILPETLLDKIDTRRLKGKIYIDKGF